MSVESAILSGFAFFSCCIDVLLSFCNDHQIKKSMATDTRNSAAQAAANQKNQTPKPPAPASP